MAAPTSYVAAMATEQHPSGPDRRSFLKGALVTGVGGGLLAAATATRAQPTKPASVNMSTFAAPAMERVRVAVIGLGNRGGSMIPGFLNLDWVDITAVADKVPEKVARAKDTVQSMRDGFEPATYDTADGWKQLCERDDVDAVYIATPWDLHAPQAVYAMEHGKHAMVEVPCCLTMDEAWQLVETSERTKMHCAIMENCCYGSSELTVLAMQRDGVFGTLVHGAGAYLHDLRDLHFSPTYYEDQWRLRFCKEINCNHYPTHGLGPVAWYMDINRGDQFDYMVTVASKQAGMIEFAREHFGEDSPEAKADYLLGDMNTSIIKTKQGRSILVQHDVTTGRPYSRINQIAGTKGIFEGYPDRMAMQPNAHQWLSQEELAAKMKQYEHPLWTEVGKLAREVGGHGGMDFVMLYRTLDCLRAGKPIDLPVYDAAAWSVLFPLSVKSMAQRGGSVDLPDFTRGNWKATPPVMSEFDA